MDSSKVVIEIIDSKGKTIRTLDNQKDKNFVKYEGGPTEKQVIPSKKGINRTSWDLRKEGLVGINKVFVNGDYRGALVAPNNFKIRLLAGKDTSFTQAKVISDPRLKATKQDFEAQENFLKTIENSVTEIHATVINMRKIKAQLESYTTLLKDKKDNLINLMSIPFTVDGGENSYQANSKDSLSICLEQIELIFKNNNCINVISCKLSNYYGADDGGSLYFFDVMLNSTGKKKLKINICAKMLKELLLTQLIVR